MEISAEVLEQKATKSTKRLVQALASCQFALLPDYSGAETLTVNKALPQTRMWHSHLSVSSLFGSWEQIQGDQSCLKLSFGIPSNAAAPDGMHHFIFCPHRDTQLPTAQMAEPGRLLYHCHPPVSLRHSDIQGMSSLGRSACSQAGKPAKTPLAQSPGSGARNGCPVSQQS